MTATRIIGLAIVVITGARPISRIGGRIGVAVAGRRGVGEAQAERVGRVDAGRGAAAGEPAACPPEE